MLTVAYSRGHNFGSWLIRASSWWGAWSHAGIVTPEGTVIEARAWDGVIECSLEEFRERSSKMTQILVECPYPEEAIAFARAQLGKPYDWGAVFGFPFREPWHHVNKWECVELIETALVVGGRPRFRSETFRITPHQSSMVI